MFPSQLNHDTENITLTGSDNIIHPPEEPSMENYLKKDILSRSLFKFRTLLHYHLSFKKKFSSMGGRPCVWGIWNVELYGPNISIGKNVVFLAATGSKTNLTTLKMNGYEGSIEIGNNVLVMNGVRISSAGKIVIGDDCMLANFCYLTDADWHDIHDRTSMGKVRPIILERGAWIGDSAIICKGVRIGENSVIGAGSVVRKDVPSNVIVAGNPAKIVGRIDPKKVVHLGSVYDQVGGPRL